MVFDWLSLWIFHLPIPQIPVIINQLAVPNNWYLNYCIFWWMAQNIRGLAKQYRKWLIFQLIVITFPKANFILMDPRPLFSMITNNHLTKSRQIIQTIFVKRRKEFLFLKWFSDNYGIIIQNPPKMEVPMKNCLKMTKQIDGWCINSNMDLNRFHALQGTWIMFLNFDSQAYITVMSALSKFPVEAI